MESKSCAQSKQAARSEKNKTLTLGEKIDVIRQYEKGGTGASARALAKVFGVGKTQIQNIVKRKLEYLADFENNAPINKRRNSKRTANEDINNVPLPNTAATLSPEGSANDGSTEESQPDHHCAPFCKQTEEHRRSKRAAMANSALDHGNIGGPPEDTGDPGRDGTDRQQVLPLLRGRAVRSEKNKTLTLGEKIDVIRQYEKGGTGARAIAKAFGVGKTQIQNIINRKREHLEDFENNAPINKRRNIKQTANEDINKLCWQYFCETTVRPVTGPMLQQQALKFAEQLGVVGFKASNGWLESFKSRHNIAIGSKTSKSADITGVVYEWTDKVADITTGYSAEDIYNMDETGLFFRTTFNQTCMKGDHSYFSGKNQAKDCLTIVLCANMAGEKERPLVIGQSARPGCFKSLQLSSLPVSYAHNKMSWMTSELFLDWLRSFDLKMGRENRKVLLFLDHAPCHPHVKLRNVELAYFPPNATLGIQPLGQGVIQRFKLKYRKRQLTRILQDMQRDRQATGEELAMQLSVLDAIHWIGSAWQDITEGTIQKCFEKAGFAINFGCITPVNAEPVDLTSESEDQIGMDVLTQEVFGCDFEGLAVVDQDLATCDTEGRDWDEDATILLDELQASEETADDSDDDTESSRDNPIRDLNTLVDLMKHIKDFCAEEGLGDLLNAFQQADDILSSVWSEGQGTAK